MDAFLYHIGTYPTIVYTIGLGVVLGYWFIVMLGLFDLEFFDVDVDMDFDTDVSDIVGFAGLLYSLGLTGVPISIVFSFLMLDSWIFSYIISRFIPIFPDLLSWIQVLINVGIMLLSFALAIPVTARMIRPLKRFFRKLNQAPMSITLIGKSCRVRSSRVDNNFGEAECINEGASLLLKIRSVGEDIFTIRDIVRIIEHRKNDDIFVVVSEKEFNNQMN